MSVTVTEVLAEIGSGNPDKKNRFSKKSFTKLVNAMASDPDCVAEVALIKKGEFEGYEEIAVGQQFRAWVQKLVEKAGIDPAESKMVGDATFTIPPMDWFYDFMAEALWEYLDSGNKFDLHRKEDFDGSLKTAFVKASSVTKPATKPGSNEPLGIFTTEKKDHKKLVASSPCPKNLAKRIRVED